MGSKTGISWTDATWNPTKGCEQVSPGCRNCYAKHQAARIVRMSKGKPSKYDGLIKIGPHGDPCWTGEGAFDAETLALPLRWRSPRRVFVDSMSDLFFEKFTNEQIAAVFGVMVAAPQHTFQVLTKRAQRMREWFEWAGTLNLDHLRTFAQRALDPTFTKRYVDRGRHWPLDNVWLGVSVENQAAADERIPELLRTPAAVRFLSCEPLIGEVDLDIPRCGDDTHADDWGVADDEATPWCMRCDSERSYGHWLYLDGGIDWVIAGCESGPGARPCSVEWLRSLRDQCASAGVPFFLKQAVETDPGRCGDADNPNGDKPCGQRIRVFVNGPGDGSWSCGCTVEAPEFGAAVDVGAGDGSKRKPGGVIELPYLDGVQHAAFPEVR